MAAASATFSGSKKSGALPHRLQAEKKTANGVGGECKKPTGGDRLEVPCPSNNDKIPILISREDRRSLNSIASSMISRCLGKPNSIRGATGNMFNASPPPPPRLRMPCHGRRRGSECPGLVTAAAAAVQNAQGPSPPPPPRFRTRPAIPPAVPPAVPPVAGQAPHTHERSVSHLQQHDDRLARNASSGEISISVRGGRRYFQRPKIALTASRGIRGFTETRVSRAAACYVFTRRKIAAPLRANG